MPWGGYAPMPIRLGGSDEEGWAPEQHARMCGDVVAAKRSAPFCVFTIVQNGDSDWSIESYYGQNGVGLAYAPTSFTYNGDGDITIQFASAYWEDDYEIQHPIKFRSAVATAHVTSANMLEVQTELVARGVRIRIQDGDGAGSFEGTAGRATVVLS